MLTNAVNDTKVLTSLKAICYDAVLTVHLQMIVELLVTVTQSVIAMHEHGVWCTCNTCFLICFDFWLCPAGFVSALMPALQYMLFWYPLAMDMLPFMSQTAAIRVVLMQEDALEVVSHVLRPTSVNDEVHNPLGSVLANTQAMYSHMLCHHGITKDMGHVFSYTQAGCVLCRSLCLSIYIAHSVGVRAAKYYTSAPQRRPSAV